MSEFTEKLLASIIKKNNQGYLILKNCGTLFDSTLGVGGVTHSLNLVIRPERGQEIISEESIKPEDISISPKDNGYKIKLSTETFNNVSSQVNRYNGKFETIVKEYTTADNKVCGGPHEFATSPEGDISLILDSQTPDAQYVNGPASSSAAQSASSEALFSGVKQDMPNNPGAAPATATKKKSLLFPIIAAIIALLLLLLAFLWWKGVFNGEDNIVEQEPQVTSSQSADETAVQNTQKEESDDNSAKAENEKSDPAEAAANEQMSGQNSEEAQTPAVQTESQPSVAVASQTASAGTATGACVLSSQKDDEIISNCLSSNPKIEAISSLSQQSLENDRCDLGKRLLSSYGRKDSAAAYLFAKYFDPNSNAQSKCIQKDKTQAIYWYQKASDLGMTEAKDAIGKLKE